MSEPLYSSGMSSASSSHKRTFDAIGPEAETDRSEPQHAGRSRRDSPVRSSSRAEASRERNKRARNDSDSSYTSELDDILLSTADSTSSSSGSSNSSYHSAQSTLPSATSPTLLDETEEDMLIDAVVSESHTRPTSPIARQPPSFEDFLFGPARQSPPPVLQPGPYEDITRSLERASAFDREIAPLRSSPAVLPTSSSRGAGPLPPVRLPPGLDDDLDFPDPYSTQDDPLSNREEGFGVFDASWLTFDQSEDGPSRVLRRRRAGSTSSSLDVNVGGSRFAPTEPHRSSDVEPAIRAHSPVGRYLDPHGTAPSMTNDTWWRRSNEMARVRRLSDFFTHPSAVPAAAASDASSNDRLGWRRDVYGLQMNLFDALNYDRVRDGASQSSTRSPRNTPAYTPRRFSDGLEARTMGSPNSAPRTTPQPIRPAHPRSSPRLSTMAARDVRSTLDDSYGTAQERRTEELDRTLREVEAHRRRIAEFLAEPLPPFPPYPAASTAAMSSLPTSSYSTLRHALDDNATTDAARRVPPSAQEPTHGRDSLARERNARRLDDAARMDDYYVDLSEWEPTNPMFLDLPPRRRGPYRTQTVEETRTMGPNPVQPPRPAWPPPAQNMDDALLGYTESQLEANSRVRANDLSGLRHRARPRSPSPPVQLPERPQDTPYSLSWYPPLTGVDEYLRDWPWPYEHSQPSLSPFYPSRTAEDDAMLQSFTERHTQPRRASPVRSASASSTARSVEDSSRPTRSVNINLDAFRDGPFRATLARSVALQHRSGNDRPEPPATRSERRDLPEPPAAPASPDLWFRRTPAVDDDVATAVPYRTRHTHTEATPDPVDPWTYEAIHRRMRLRHERAETHSEADSTRARSPQGNETHRPRPPAESTTSAELRHAHHTRPFVPLVPRPSYRAGESRSTALREEADRRLRHRTLLDREHSSSWAAAEDAESRASARIERVQRQREMVHRMMARRGEVPRPTSASASSARNESEPARASTQPSTDNPANPPSSTAWTRRYTRLGGVSAFREGRPEDRPAPLNGRFARRGTFTPHYPPDMVWVDVPPGRHSAFMRRRNLGDYVRDEDFDVSYEGLLSLSSLLGDAKPRGTPDDIIASLPKGKYREWTRPGATEERCPICLDDYQPDDPCLRVCGCSHWFHEGCLQQWLKTARTCPVCRGRVTKPRTEEPPAPVAGPSGSNDRGRDDDDDSDERDVGRPMARHWHSFHPPWRHD